MDKYKDYIIDNNKIDNHNKTLYLLKDDIYIIDKIKDSKFKNNNIKNVDDIFHKINIFN
jgi:hypothetical protein